MYVSLSLRTVFAGLALLAIAPSLRAAENDWPTYRHDTCRSGATTEQLAPPLHLQWSHLARQAPCPAWPEPVREVNLLGFDRAYQVVEADGMVYFGSSADHQLHALDLATGRERWRFFTDAPLRFAPQVYEQKVYVAGDDGHVYCLAAADGKLLWKFRGGPADERLLGNSAMVSRWPLRSGLLIENGAVYFTAGMWPSETVYAYALKAADGGLLWKTENNGKFAPQGYLTLAGKQLVALAGRAQAKRIECADGKIIDAAGMAQAAIAGDLFFTGPYTQGANENLPAPGGVPMAERARRISAWKTGSKRPIAEFGGMDLVAIGHDMVFLAGSGKISAHALPRLEKKWEITAAPVYALAVAGSHLLVGGENSVALLDAAKGERLWSGEVSGQVHGLAIARGRLLASTDSGQIACFAAEPGERSAASNATAPAVPTEGGAARAAEILKAANIRDGFCLLIGGDERLACELAKHSNLRIYCPESDAKRVAAAREYLDAAGVYGTRVVVHQLPDKTLPYADYFADLIVVDERSAASIPYLPSELRRILRPCGGTALLINAQAESKPMLSLAAPGLTETHPAANIRKLVRGKLTGAGQWTHQYADAGNSDSSGDQLVRWPLKILWFGEPGPERMMNRHWRGTAPLYLDGRMFILGQHCVMAYDAYNGRKLWLRDLPAIARRAVDTQGGSMLVEGDGLYVVNAEICLRFDVVTGDLMRLYQIPVARPRYSLVAPQSFDLAELGKAEICNSPDALTIKLTTSDTCVTNADREHAPTAGDSWELFFDFRPSDRRTGLYGPGAFQLIVVPASNEQAAATAHRGPSSAPPAAEVSGTRDAHGSQTTVRIAWSDIAKLTGGRSADFQFGLALNSSSDGKLVTRRTYRFANHASYRLANCWATLFAGPLPPPSAADGPPPLELGEPERLAWGNLAAAGDVLLGTIAALKDSPFVLARGWDFASEGHDYTGPTAQQVLDMIGVQGGADCLFALDKQSGRLRWVYKPKSVLSNNGVAVSGGRVYLLDGPFTADDQRLKLLDRTLAKQPTLVALDLATGKELWRKDEGVAGAEALRAGHGVLLATHLKGLTAFDAADGKQLWSVGTTQPMHHCSAFLRVPVITSEWIYDEPFAYRLRTGAARVDTAGKPWQWGGFSGCGTVSASDSMLFYRNGNPTMLDAAEGSGAHPLLGIRPGCFLNIIAAGGLLLMPEASSGCGCPFNFQTTVVLKHADDSGRSETGTRLPVEMTQK